MRQLINAAEFPKPTFVQPPTMEELFAEKLAIFKQFAPEYAYFLATDPGVKVMRMLALAELNHYALANDRAVATLLTHATGADLDSLGINSGVVRMVIQEADPDANPPIPEILEDDERYRSRIADANVAFSSAGPPEHWRFHAMSADARVKDAVVYSPDLPNFLNMGGRISIAILSAVDNGVPSLDILTAVRAMVNHKKVKVAGTIVEVEPATIRPIDVVADFILERNAPPDILIQIEKNLREAFAKAQRLGWDAPKSWFTRILSPDGVYESVLASPSTTLTVRPNQFPALNSVTLRFAGLVADEDWQNDELATARMLREVHETYISYAVATNRTRVQIQDDLILERRPGIVQPSLIGIAEFLGLTGIRKNGSLLPDDEIAILIHYELSKYYERGFYSN